MRNLTILAALCASLAACSSAQTQQAVSDGQLFCATATAAGPLVVAVADAAGAPVSVIGRSADAVAALCAALKAIPVVPPPNPAAAPVVAVAAPAAVK